MPKLRASLMLAKMETRPKLEVKRRKERRRKVKRRKEKKVRNPKLPVTRPRAEMLTRARIRRELTPAVTILRPTLLRWLIKPRN